MDGTFRIFSSQMYGWVDNKASLVDAKTRAPAIQSLAFRINFHQTGCRYLAVEQTIRVDQKTITSAMLSGTSDLLRDRENKLSIRHLPRWPRNSHWSPLCLAQNVWTRTIKALVQGNGGWKNKNLNLAVAINITNIRCTAPWNVYKSNVFLPADNKQIKVHSVRGHPIKTKLTVQWL